MEQERDILSRIIAFEKEVQERLRQEKSESLERLEEVRKATEEKIAREEELLKKTYGQKAEGIKDGPERKAAAIIRQSEAWAEGLGAISEETLMRIVMKHVARILPGE
ncbi:MAG: hypothetical protein M1497_08480 [Nitrospirae bacterium]|nr:hypothetical protein [Nitrospirota bacterium]